MKERIRWIDNAKGICVFCVLLAHCKLHHPYIQMVYTPFFLTMFFFLSGYLYRCRTFKEDIFKLTRTLIIPYFLLCFLILFIGKDNWESVLNGNFEMVAHRTLRILYGYDLWFVSCLIAVQLYYILLYHVYMKNLKYKILTAIALLPSVYLIKNTDSQMMPYYCDIALFALSFFISGNVFKELTSRYKIKTYSNSAIGIAILLCYIFIALVMQLNLDMEFHFAYNYYSSPAFFIILSLLGMFTIYIISNLFPLSFLEKIGRNSLVFFAFNGKALALTMLLFRHINSIYDCQYLSAFIICIVQSFILLGFSKIINTYVPFLIGKQKNENSTFKSTSL